MRPAPAEAGDDLVGLLLLVIEDDELAREGMVRLLESWGAIVRVADSLATALAQLKAGLEPDVIVSDYRLRDGENGIDVINQLRSAAGEPIAACLMSGNTTPELMQAARAAGLSLLHKPVRPAKLRSLVRSLASHHDEAEGGGLV
jgi:CheY-like chemotaxis protein